MLVIDVDANLYPTFTISNIANDTTSDDFLVEVLDAGGECYNRIGHYDIKDSDRSITFTIKAGDKSKIHISCSSIKTMDVNGNGCITSVSGVMPSGLIHCRNMFKNCYSLKTVDKYIFSGLSDVNDFSYAFYRCSDLIEVPYGLFDGCVSAKTFDSCFMGCDNIASIPATLFDQCDVVDVSYAFANCKGITGNVPSLWDKPSIQGNRCFWNCNNAANYSEIPTMWK